MQIIPALIYTNERWPKKILLLACACALVCAGCVPKKRPDFPVNQLAMNHPIVPQPLDVSLTDPPDIPFEVDLVPRLVVPRGTPARPRVAAAPVPGPAPAEKPPEPIIAPELSNEQLSEAKLETQQSLIVAERNLSLTQGRALDAAQQDLVSKIRGFVDSAREAMKENDWQRARSQAKKAEVLSKEFAPNP
ncbi:MAG TPA: hypothetical protein VNY24_20505 [Candidatus Acidoferrales bacterium]|jgi:hypothetical protein|nr:hypothetical protein [Candidatus Acidoferrales bacterium]